MAIIKKVGAKGIVNKGSGLGALRAAQRNETLRAQEHLVLCLDASGSMGDPVDGRLYDWRSSDNAKKKLWVAKEAAQALIKDCTSATTVGLVQFSSYADVLRALDYGSEGIFAALDKYDITGGTMAWTGLRSSLDLLDCAGDVALRRVILMTDGQDFDSDPHPSEQNRRLRHDEVKRAVDTKTVIDCIAFGPDAAIEDLKSIASPTGGVVRVAGDEKSLVREFKRLEAGIRGLLGSGG
jgi:Mg-chelatase subunit ChlD